MYIKFYTVYIINVSTWNKVLFPSTKKTSVRTRSRRLSGRTGCARRTRYSTLRTTCPSWSPFSLSRLYSNSQKARWVTQLLAPSSAAWAFLPPPRYIPFLLEYSNFVGNLRSPGLPDAISLQSNRTRPNQPLINSSFSHAYTKLLLIIVDHQSFCLAAKFKSRYSQSEKKVAPVFPISIRIVPQKSQINFN